MIYAFCSYLVCRKNFPMKEYIEKNKERFLSELFEWLRIPSVSADSSYDEDVMKAARFLEKEFNRLELDNVEVCETKGHPIVYAEKIVNPDWPTVLVYGHYDVQPADPIELWDSPPFEPEIRNEKIYARGACDDKGQAFMHVKAYEVMKETDNLTCNIKFMMEGEEEVGSVHLGDFVRDNKEKLKADVILISDTGIIANDVPSITVGLRGLSYVEVELTGPNRDLHSGLYGGAVDNPINVLTDLISSLKDENGRITIPGFYDDVEEVSDEERSKMAQAPIHDSTYLEELDVEELNGEKGYSTLERVSIRPTLDVNGIVGGYIGEGAKTVLPSKASAKISMRLVPNQNSDKISTLFKEHFEKITPKTMKAKVTLHHGGEAYVTPITFGAYQAASDAMKETFGKEPIPMRSGGSIPIVALFEEVLGLKTILMGFGLDSDAIHSPNEHYGLFNFFKGIETIPHFYKNLNK